MTEPTLFAESGFRRLRIELAYDGTNYFGWGKQPDRRTIQEEVENALSTVSQVKIDSVVAGRTDAGVHAIGQVIHVDVPEDLKIEDLVFKLNRILDQDIRIHKIDLAEPGFHARFSALRRHYIYKIVDDNQVVAPLMRLDVAPWYRTLDLDLMNQASQLLLGENDFFAFCKFRESSTTIRTLERFDWMRNEDGVLVANVIADAFCYSMVRNLVGAVACVGEGRFPPSWITSVLANAERISDGMVFPARGLTLKSVDYPPADQLLARIESTLRRRGDEE